MTPAEHYAEAERLAAIARKPILAGAPIGFNTHRDVVALAQMHATLALYRDGDPTGCRWERPGDEPEPCPDGVDGTPMGRRWPQDHADDVRVANEPVDGVWKFEPPAEVTSVVDDDNDTWEWCPGGLWRCLGFPLEPRSWTDLQNDHGPIRAVKS